MVNRCPLLVVRRHNVCRKSTMASISRAVKMRCRPNGGITLCGLRLVSSGRMGTRLLRSGYLLLMSLSAGPMVPGSSPPLMSWQLRQLPLPRSNASLCPSEARDCAPAGAAAAPISQATVNAEIKVGFVEGVLDNGASDYVDGSRI